MDRSSVWRLCGLALCLGLVGCGDDAPPTGGAQQEVNNSSANEDAGGEADADASDDASPDAPDVKEEPAELPRLLARLETSLSTTEARAGEEVQVRCVGLDEQGEPLALAEGVELRAQFAPTASVTLGAGPLDLVPVRAGEVTVSCALPREGLIDTTPAVLRVAPGDPYTVVAQVERRLVSAGESLGVECTGYDRLGNEVEVPQAQVRLDAQGDGILIEGRQVTVTRADLYAATCFIDGAQELVADTFEVVPALPASLLVGKHPNQGVYALGQVVEVTADVSDRHGNPIPWAIVGVTSAPAAGNFGERRFQFDEEGTFRLTARVEGPTQDDAPLSGQVEVVVNGAGPAITCVSPSDGEMVQATPGQNLTFRGRVRDNNGVESVTVEGRAAQLSPDGSFEVALPAGFGVNGVEILATDAFGSRSARTCTFLAADRWNAESASLGDGVTLKLTQGAVDDNNRGGGINSLADLLHTALNSRSLVDTLDQTLDRANPIYPEQCVQEVCLPLVGCNCVYRLSARYESLEINGPNTVSLALVDGGLRIGAVVRGLGLRVSVGGTIGASGWVRASEISMELTSDLFLENGNPRVRLRGQPTVNIEGLNVDIDGLLGFLFDIVEPLFRGLITNTVQTQLRNYVSGNFNQILDGVVGGLDISTLGTGVDVPRLDGRGTLRLGFGVDFSSVSVNPSRALFGIGTRFTGPQNHAGTSRGVALPSGEVRLDPQTSRGVAATVHVGVLNQALHTLWRGGLFDATISGATLGAGDDVEATLYTGLPPVLTLNGDRARLGLGAVRITLDWPSLLGAPLDVQVSAQAEATVSLSGDELRFGGLTLREFKLAAEGISLDPTTQAILEEFVRGLIQRVIDDTLNDALPALPIPSFTVPDSLSSFGIPRGTELGLRSPALLLRERHLVLESDFGTR